MPIILDQDILTSPSVRALPETCRLRFPWDIVASCPDAFGCFEIELDFILARLRKNLPGETKEALQDRLLAYSERPRDENGSESDDLPILEVWRDSTGRLYGHWLAWFRPARVGRKTARLNRYRKDYARRTPIPPSLARVGGDPTKINNWRTLPVRDFWQQDAPRQPATEPRQLLASNSDSDTNSNSHTVAESELLEKGEPAKPEPAATARGDPPIPIEAIRPEQILRSMAAVVERRWAVPWIAPDTLAHEVGAILREGVSRETLLAVWAHYVNTRQDPAKISIPWFVKEFNRHQAEEARHG